LLSDEGELIKYNLTTGKGTKFKGSKKIKMGVQDAQVPILISLLPNNEVRFQSPLTSNIRVTLSKLRILRPYPSLGRLDTVGGDLWGQGGYLQSSHGVVDMVPLKDIIEIDSMEKIREENGVVVSKTGEGYHVIQQYAIRGCVAATANMMRADYDKPLNISILKDTNLANEDAHIDYFDSKKWLQEVGLITVIRTAGDISQFKHLLDTYGPAVIDVSTGAGGHNIIVDQITEDLQTVWIREPNQGWRVRVSLRFLQSWGVEEGSKILQVKNRLILQKSA